MLCNFLLRIPRTLNVTMCRSLPGQDTGLWLRYWQLWMKNVWHMFVMLLRLTQIKPREADDKVRKPNQNCRACRSCKALQCLVVRDRTATIASTGECDIAFWGGHTSLLRFSNSITVNLANIHYWCYFPWICIPIVVFRGNRYATVTILTLVENDGHKYASYEILTQIDRVVLHNRSVVNYWPTRSTIDSTFDPLDDSTRLGRMAIDLIDLANFWHS